MNITSSHGQDTHMAASLLRTITDDAQYRTPFLESTVLTVSVPKSVVDMHNYIVAS
jgi:hypothetical protein